jgi:hypothetical protein
MRHPSRSCAFFGRLLLLPFFLLLVLIALLLFGIFVCVPLLLSFCALLALYYGCTEDPVPPRVLWNALVRDDPPWHAQSITQLYTRQELPANLLQRRLLRRISTIESDEGDHGLNVQLHRDERGPVYYQQESNVWLFTELVYISADIQGDDNLHSDCVPSVTDSQRADEEETENDRHDDENIEQQPSIVLTATPTPTITDSEESTLTVVPNGTDDETLTDNKSLVSDDNNDHLMACNICLIAFEPNDIVAWSCNRKCPHCFHSDCIIEWLLRRPTCPSCRQDYIKKNNDTTADNNDSNRSTLGVATGAARGETTDATRQLQVQPTSGSDEHV